MPTAPATPSRALLQRMQAEVGAPAPSEAMLAGFDAIGQIPLPSRLATAELSLASVAAATLAADHDVSALDPERIAVAFQSDRHFSVGESAPSVWAAASGFWRTGDGWIRTHGNYPHHAAALTSALGLGSTSDADSVAAAVRALSAVDAVDRITTAGGLAVEVRREVSASDEDLRRSPLIDVSSVDARSRAVGKRTPSVVGARVLDLTRVIAGPVCTRTLALLGADVLRIDPPGLPELPWQHLDTGHGKRTAVLDARSAVMEELLESADVVVLGYRPAALERLGLSPAALVDRHPGLIVAQLSAWGVDQPDRAGFDSLVQAESGIAMVESPDGDRPGALPAQALDHSSGYLIAAAVTTALERRAREGGSWLIRTSLRRVAAELLGMPRRDEPAAVTAFDPAPHLERFDVEGTEVVTAASAIPGTRFTAPHRWGSDAPRW